MLASPLKRGFFVTIDVAGFAGSYYEITAVEGFTYVTGEETTAYFSTVASGSESGFKNIEVLEPSDSPPRLFYLVFGVKDLAKYYVKIPSGSDRFGTDEDKDIGYIDAQISPYFEPNEDFAFWLVQDYYPSINCKNVTPVTITPKIWFYGYKYDIQKVTSAETIAKLKSGIIPHTEVTLGGVKEK